MPHGTRRSPGVDEPDLYPYGWPRRAMPLPPVNTFLTDLAFLSRAVTCVLRMTVRPLTRHGRRVVEGAERPVRMARAQSEVRAVHPTRDPDGTTGWLGIPSAPSLN